MIFDNSLIMAIIAINMTVIGLTSLADKKTVIGVDYGEFLIKEFKLLKIRRYYWLVIFACINIISLFVMFSNKPILRVINFLFLILSLIFAIFYFFRFILIENKWVVKQIYIRELLGLYCNSDDLKHFYVDKMVMMNPGTRTSRKLSTNVVNYFNTYNSTTQRVFEEVFGPNSIIYSNEKDIIKARDKHFNIDPYRYRSSELNDSIKDISFEFFQVFRFVENQEKWTLDILRILNGGEPREYSNYDIFRVYNLARMTAQIKVFGSSENSFKYKFWENYRLYWYAAVHKRNSEQFEESEKAHIIQIEKEIITSIFSTITKIIINKDDIDVINVTQKILEEIAFEDQYNGFLNVQQVFETIIEVSFENDCHKLNLVIEEVLSRYMNTEEKRAKIDLEALKNRVVEMENKKSKISEKRVELFNFNYTLIK